MKDLTIPRWIKLARKLAEREKLWSKFVGFMYMGEDQDDPLLGCGGGDGDGDDDVEVGLDEKDWQEDSWGEDGGDTGEDEVDMEEWEVPQEGQWPLHTDLREDED